MLERVRETVTRWTRRGHEPASPATLLFADHDEIQDIARQMARTKIEIDRSVLTMRSWARDLGRRLEDSRGTLTRADDLRSLGETVGGLAHNLNNSLAAILAYSELMLRDAPTGTAKRRLSVMRDVALEASATVRRLQEFVSRQPQVAFGPVGLPAVIAQAVEMTAPRWRDEAQRRGIAIAVTQDMEALPPVEGNAFELRDALMRLILNAVTAMPEGGALGIRAASEESGWVVVEVRDTGVGMPPEMQRRIAERAKSLAPGRGASHGLLEVADIVERHGGALSVESEAGKGTVVRMRLHASRFQIIPATGGLADRGVRPALAAGVLLVDDDPRLVAVLSDMLRGGGPCRDDRDQGRGGDRPVRSRRARRGDHRSRHAADDGLGSRRAHQEQVARDPRVPAHRLGRERVRPRVEPVRRPRDRQARLGPVAAGAPRRAEAAPPPVRVTPVLPRPAASVLLVRAGARALEVFMIRRRKTMRFMGGYYAFPGGKVDPADATAEALARCRGLAPAAAARLVPAIDGVEPLAFWISAARELLEEVGVLLAVAEDGGAVDVREPDVAARVERMRRDLLADAAPFCVAPRAGGLVSRPRAPSATSRTSSRRRRARSASPRASSSPRCPLGRTCAAR